MAITLDPGVWNFGKPRSKKKSQEDEFSRTKVRVVLKGPNGYLEANTATSLETLNEDGNTFRYNIGGITIYVSGHNAITKGEYEYILGHPIEELQDVKQKVKLKNPSKFTQVDFEEFGKKYCGCNNPDTNALLMEKLVCIKLVSPHEFDEYFTVEVDPPYSKNIKLYLDRLADLVNTELKEKEEISDLDILQKRAYEFTDYKKKTFVEVKLKAIESSDYFRFRLHVGENTLITKDQLNYVDKLKGAIDGFTDKLLRRGKPQILCEKGFMSNVNKVGSVNFKMRPHIYDPVGEYITHFLYVDSVKNYIENIGRNNDDLRCYLTQLIQPTALFIFDKNCEYILQKNVVVTDEWKVKFEKCLSYMGENFSTMEETIVQEDHV